MKFLKSWPLKTFLALSAVICLGQLATAQTVYENYTFITLAGPPSGGPGSWDGLGNAARFWSPDGISRDSNGNIFVTDADNSTIRKITSAGLVTTVAGMAGFPGTNDGLGAAARFNSPAAVAEDSKGNIFVADSKNNTIRKISTNGMVTTFAGQAGVSGSKDGTGSAAQFDSPRGIAIDGNDNIFISDTLNDTIRKITPAGVVTTFAGFAGRAGNSDAKGNLASFRDPLGLAVDSTGNIYVADAVNQIIRKITTNAVVSTIAGQVLAQGHADGTNANFDFPAGLAVDGSNNVYVADSFDHTIRLITPDGNVTTPVGSPGTSGGVNGIGSAALFNFPLSVAVDNAGNVYVSDSGNNCIRQVAPGVVVTTFAGILGGTGSTDGPAAIARFSHPSDVALDANGNTYVADADNATIRKIASDGTVSTLAGSAGKIGTNDAVGSDARFQEPIGVTLDNFGNILVADTFNDTVRQVTPAGVVTTIAGVPQVTSTNGFIGTNATFNQPIKTTVDSANNIYVSDTQDDAIRQISPAGVVTTFAGTIHAPGTNDGTGLAAGLFRPEGIEIDAASNIYFIDSGSSRVRKITPDGQVSTIAGQTGVFGSDDGNSATATFGSPDGIAEDSNGNLYIGDSGNDIIRKISPSGSVTTIGGVPGHIGSADGTGSDALFNGPNGLAVDNQGNIYVADGLNQCIRKGYPALPDMPVVDRIGAPRGVTRNFSIANQTTTIWSWTFIRQPTGSSAQIVGANTANPTFTPDIDDIYIIQFQGWDNSGHTTIRRITLYADDTPPTITITNPVSGGTVSNGLFSVAGTTTDDLGVSNVFVQLNGGSWTNATGTTNWAVIQNLVPGTNKILAYSEDFAGNVSATNESDFLYILSDQLKVFVKGGGTLKPNLNGVFLRIGQAYSISVKAASGSTFSNWTANLIPGTNSQTFSFVMQSNLTLTANCIDHTKPTIAVTFPKPAKFYSAASTFVVGTAKDNDSVTNVFYQLNGGAWTNATGTTNWFTSVNLNSGTNILLVYAQDPSGNRSTTNRVMLNYLPTAIAGGNYAGLFFDTNNLAATNAGFFSAAVTPTAAFTAKLLLGASTVSFSGQFSQDGVFSNSFVPKGFSTPFTAQLQLDLTGAGTITGTIASSDWSVPLLAIQDTFSTANPPSQQFQRFTLVIPGGDDSSTQPGGNSAGTIILDGVGGVSFIGSLADGSAAAQQTFISKGGLWPFYISSAHGQGVTLGWLTFSSGQRGTLTGQVYWERLPQANASLYPAGFNFTNGIPASGSFFDYHVNVPTLSVPGGGMVVLQQAVSPPLTNYFTVTSHGASDIVTSTNKLKLNITFFTAAFKGTMVNPANNLSIPFSGVILTNQNVGFGFFTNNNQSGSVCLTNAP